MATRKRTRARELALQFLYGVDVRGDDEPAEVEFVVASRDWGRVPLDEGTRGVVNAGMKIVYDPEGLLATAARAAKAVDEQAHGSRPQPSVDESGAFELSIE